MKTIFVIGTRTYKENVIYKEIGNDIYLEVGYTAHLENNTIYGECGETTFKFEIPKDKDGYKLVVAFMGLSNPFGDKLKNVETSEELLKMIKKSVVEGGTGLHSGNADVYIHKSTGDCFVNSIKNVEIYNGTEEAVVKVLADGNVETVANAKIYGDETVLRLKNTENKPCKIKNAEHENCVFLHGGAFELDQCRLTDLKIATGSLDSNVVVKNSTIHTLQLFESTEKITKNVGETFINRVIANENNTVAVCEYWKPSDEIESDEAYESTKIEIKLPAKVEQLASFKELEGRKYLEKSIEYPESVISIVGCTLNKPITIRDSLGQPIMLQWVKTKSTITIEEQTTKTDRTTIKFWGVECSGGVKFRGSYNNLDIRLLSHKNHLGSLIFTQGSNLKVSITEAELTVGILYFSKNCTLSEIPEYEMSAIKSIIKKALAVIAPEQIYNNFTKVVKRLTKSDNAEAEIEKVWNSLTGDKNKAEAMYKKALLMYGNDKLARIGVTNLNKINIPALVTISNMNENFLDNTGVKLEDLEELIDALVAHKHNKEELKNVLTELWITNRNYKTRQTARDNIKHVVWCFKNLVDYSTEAVAKLEERPKKIMASLDFLGGLSTKNERYEITCGMLSRRHTNEDAYVAFILTRLRDNKSIVLKCVENSMYNKAREYLFTDIARGKKLFDMLIPGDVIEGRVNTIGGHILSVRDWETRGVVQGGSAQQFCIKTVIPELNIGAIVKNGYFVRKAPLRECIESTEAHGLSYLGEIKETNCSTKEELKELRQRFKGELFKSAWAEDIQSVLSSSLYITRSLNRLLIEQMAGKSELKVYKFDTLFKVNEYSLSIREYLRIRGGFKEYDSQLDNEHRVYFLRVPHENKVYISTCSLEQVWKNLSENSNEITIIQEPGYRKWLDIAKDKVFMQHTDY